MDLHKKSNINSTILIIDDEPINLQILFEMLKSQGYQVRGARDGQSALSSVDMDPPDLILLDIQMPEMDGYDVCKKMKEKKLTQNIPIIFISALNEVFDKVKAFSLGGVDYISKPFQIEEVLVRVKNHLTLKYVMEKLDKQNVMLQREIDERKQIEEKLKDYNLTLEDRVKERTADLFKANKELLIAKEAAECGNQAKNDFLRSLSHELNTPLNAIIGLSDVLSVMDFEQQKEEILECLDAIQNSGRHLHSLIHEMLEFSKIDYKDTELNLSECSLKPFLNKCVHMLDKQATSKKIQIAFNVSNEIEKSKIIVDENKLKKIIIYLLSNAIKYSFEGGLVTVEAQKKEDEIFIKVCDQGVGVEPVNQENIFLSFFQVQSGLCDKSPGVGLGLTIAKGIVEKHNGNIWVESKGINKGSIFCFSLPLNN